MSKTAQLADGTTLEFPDETSDEVMDRVVQEHVSGKVQAAPPPPSQPVLSGITGKAVDYGVQMAKDIGSEAAAGYRQMRDVPTTPTMNPLETMGRGFEQFSGLMGILTSPVTGPVRTLSRSGGDVARAAGASEGVAGGVETGLNLLGNLVAVPYAVSKAAPLIASAVSKLPGAQMTLRALGQKEIESIPTSMTPPIPSKELYAKVAEASNPPIKIDNLKNTMQGIYKEQLSLQLDGKSTPAVMNMAKAMVGDSPNVSSGFTAEQVQQYLQQNPKLAAKAAATEPEMFANLMKGESTRTFKDAQALLTQYGLDSQSADATIRRANKMAYGALAKDLEAAGGSYPELQAANKTFAREKSIKELQNIIDKHIGQQLEGRPKEFTSSAFAATLKEIKKTEKTDTLFSRGFANNPAWGEQAGGSQLDTIKARLSDLAELKIAPPPSGGAAGSYQNVIRAARGTLASGATQMAEWGLGTNVPGLSIVVGSTVALTPVAISKVLQSERGTRMLAAFIKSGAEISPSNLAILLASTRLDAPEVKQFLGNYSNIMGQPTSIQDKVAAVQKKSELDAVNQEIARAVQ